MPSADPPQKPNNNGTSSSHPLSPHSQPTYLNCYGNVYLLQILIDWKLYSCRAVEAYIISFPWDFPSHCIAPWSQATIPLKYVWSPATARQHEGHGSQQRWHASKVTSRRHHLSVWSTPILLHLFPCRCRSGYIHLHYTLIIHSWKNTSNPLLHVCVTDIQFAMVPHEHVHCV
jgi:hypothetical protein